MFEPFSFLSPEQIFRPEIILLLLVAGFFTGVVNTIAGSGTAIGYSVMVYLGLPVQVANGTVRMGVVMQTLAAAFTFHKGKALEWRNGFLISIPVTLGSIIGAEIAVGIDKQVFERIVGAVVIIMLFSVFYKPEKWVEGQKEKTVHKPLWWHYLVYTVIGLYGGFIHIGVGIFLLVALVLMSGYDLVKANALKIFIVFIYSPFVLAVFMFNHQVDYSVGLITSVGNLVGGIVASHYAVRKGAGFVRWVLMIILLLFAAYLFKLHELVMLLW